MGRPPIGKQAMSGAERQRRYLDRRLQTTDTALKAELAQAKARIAELEATTPGAPLRQRPRTREDLLASKARIEAERKAKRAEIKAARLAAAAAEQPDVDVPTLLAEIDKLKQQLKGTRTQITNLRAEVRHSGQSLDQARQGQHLPDALLGTYSAACTRISSPTCR